MAETKVTLVSEDFDKVCRACLKRGELREFPPVLHDFYVKFVAVSTLWKKTVDLPSNICVPCEVHLKLVLSFYKTCRRSELLLLHISGSQVDKQLPFEIDDFKVVDCDDGDDEKDDQPKLKIDIDDDEELDSDAQMSPIQLDDIEEPEDDIDAAERSVILIEKVPEVIEISDYNINDAQTTTNNEEKNFISDYDVIDTTESNPKVTIPQKNDDMNSERKPGDLIDNDHLKKRICPVCNIDLKTKNRYKNHMFAHTKAQVTCDKCGFDCGTPAGLKLHEAKKHPASKVCKICQRSFASKASLQQHDNDVHRKKKCITCLKVFENAHKLANHVRDIHGEKKKRKDVYECLKCHHCHQTYPTEGQLRKHLMTHDVKDRLPYECRKCHQMFLTEAQLNNHLKLHDVKDRLSEFHEKFLKEGQLNKHLKSHDRHKDQLPMMSLPNVWNTNPSQKVSAKPSENFFTNATSNFASSSSLNFLQNFAQNLSSNPVQTFPSNSLQQFPGNSIQSFPANSNNIFSSPKKSLAGSSQGITSNYGQNVYSSPRNLNSDKDPNYKNPFSYYKNDH